MHKVILLFTLLTVITIFPLAASAQSDAIPSWIKNNTGWWVDGVIDDGSFVSGIEWLVSNNIIEETNFQLLQFLELLSQLYLAG